MNDPVKVRKDVIANCRRLVVKVGSRLLADIEEQSKQERIKALINNIAILRRAGYEVVLVTSGAIGTGQIMMKSAKRPRDLADLQALAAIGQSHLMSLYEQECQSHGFHCAQILLSNDDVKDRRRHLNARNCINSLLSQNVLPIINENDTVSVEEIRFGDNDRLAALVGTMIRADLNIILTTVNGFLRKENGQLKDRISHINAIDDNIRNMAGGTDGNPFSTGGMQTKLDAAEIVVAAGESMWIADGHDFSCLQRMFEGEDIGTLFTPPSEPLSGNKRWLAFFADASGEIHVDQGAFKAICENGKSLLPKGIVSLKGQFEKGDTVHICDQDKVAFAVGICNFSSEDLNAIKGLHSSEINGILGGENYDEAVHRNNLVLLQ